MLMIKVEGYAEAKAIIDQLPNNMQKRMLLAALRLSSKRMLSSAKSKVPVRSGELRRQLKVVRFRDKTAPRSEVDVAVKPVFSRTRKKGAVNQYYGKFIHEGTVNPRTSRRKGSLLVFRGRDGKMVFARAVKGIKPTPFLEEAYRENAESVVASFGENLAVAVEKYIDKNFKPINK